MDKDQIIEQQREIILELVKTLLAVMDEWEDSVLTPGEKER